MPRGFGFWLWWLTAPYWYPYLYWLWRYWLPVYWLWPLPITPYPFPTAYFGLPREQEIRILEDRRRILEEELNRISKRLEELRAE